MVKGVAANSISRERDCGFSEVTGQGDSDSKRTSILQQDPMNNIMQLSQAVSKLEQSRQNEADMPYAVLCLFVLRQAMKDSQPPNTHSTSKRTERGNIERQHITEDAHRFINGKGFDIWFKASGIKSVSSGDIRRLAENPHRLYFARRDDRDFNNI